MGKLTIRQMDIYNFMIEEADEKGYPPTVREICAAIGVKSTSTVHKDIVALEENGYLIKDPAKPRALMLSHDGPYNFSTYKNRDSYGNKISSNNFDSIDSQNSHDNACSFDTASSIDNIDDFNAANQKKSNDHSSTTSIRFGTSNSEVINIPVIGNIAAGSPIIAEQIVEDAFPVPARFVKKSGNFMLKVRGESMIEAGILDGDYILVEQHNTANNGEIVVAMINDYECEATVKTFYKENGHFRLQPENSSMEPIIVDDVTILGKVVGVFRYFN